MYEPETIGPDGGYFTIRPRDDKRVGRLTRGEAQEPVAAEPPIQFVAPRDEQPTSLREELEAMGWFTDM